jgi:hypothetical protein
MSCRAVTLVALSLSVAFAVPSLAAEIPTEVTACGQVVTTRSAVLTTDLNCGTGTGSFGVALRSKGKLDLQGHTITGGQLGVACGTMLCVGTWCGPDRRSGTCEVSNGTITGAKYAIGGRELVVRNMTFADNAAYDVLAVKKADVYDSDFQTGDVNSVQANRRVRIYDSTVNGGYIVSDKRVELRSTTVSSSSPLGVAARVIKLFGSSVTGALAHPNCGTVWVCTDLLSRIRPVLDAMSTCEKSERAPRCGPGEPIVTWGVCTLD